MEEGKGSRKGRETHEGISVSIIVIIHLGLFPACPPPKGLIPLYAAVPLIKIIIRALNRGGPSGSNVRPSRSPVLAYLCSRTGTRKTFIPAIPLPPRTKGKQPSCSHEFRSRVIIKFVIYLVYFSLIALN